MQIDPLDIAVGLDEEGHATGLQGQRFRFDAEGPRLLLTGCLHGDEITAAGALWRVAEALPRRPGLGGGVTVIPCVNQLAARASRRHIPLEITDLNRQFPGRPEGSLGERLAAALVALLAEHDALIDLHTAGWSDCFILLDHVADAALAARATAWAARSGLPVIGEMPAAESDLQGLDRSWSAWAMRSGKPAVTMELSGFHRLEVAAAERGAAAALAMIEAAPALLAASPPEMPERPRLRRSELYAGAGGIFETTRRPGERVAAGATLGCIRALTGAVRDLVVAEADGLILALQPVSAVHVGSWLATLAVAAES